MANCEVCSKFSRVDLQSRWWNDGALDGLLAAGPGAEFRAKDVYGDIAGASFLNWPLTLAELDPYYNKAEDKTGVTGTHGIPLLDANNNQIVMAEGAKKVGYKECSTGNRLSIRVLATGVQQRFRTVFVSREFAPMRNGQR
jgi:hypothetical protein